MSNDPRGRVELAPGITLEATAAAVWRVEERFDCGYLQAVQKVFDPQNMRFSVAMEFAQLLSGAPLADIQAAFDSVGLLEGYETTARAAVAGWPQADEEDGPPDPQTETSA